MELDYIKAAAQQRLGYKVGRDVETDIFQRSLDALIADLPPDPIELIYRVIFLHGEGGIGKSFLLSLFASVCEDKGIPFVFLDALDSAGQPRYLSFPNFLRALCLSLEGEPWTRRFLGKPLSRFKDAWQAYKDAENRLKSAESTTDMEIPGERLIEAAAHLAGTFGSEALGIPPGIGERGAEFALEGARLGISALRRGKRWPTGLSLLYEHMERLETALFQDVKEALGDRPIVLMIDSYDGFQAMELAVHQFLFERLELNRLIVLAARTRPSSFLHRDLIGYFFDRPVFPFTSEEARTYLIDKRSITDPQVVAAVVDLAAGLPLAVCIAADVIATAPDARQAAEWVQSGASRRADIVARVAEWLLWSLDEDRRRLMFACAVLGEFDPEALGKVQGTQVVAENVAWLTNLSFVYPVRGRLRLHGRGRRFLLEHFRGLPGDDYQRYEERAALWYQELLEGLRKLEEPYEDDNWRDWTIFKVYHWLMTGTEQGTKVFYDALADALWEQEWTFAVKLLEAAVSPPGVEAEKELLQLLLAGCRAYAQEDYAKAESPFQHLAEVAGRNARVEQIANDMLGELYRRMDGRERDSITHYQKAMRLFETFGEDRKVASTLVNQGRVYRQLGEWETAILLFKRAADIRERLSEYEMQSSALIWGAIAYRDWGRNEEALQYHKQALEAGEESRKPEQVAWARRERALTLRTAGRYDEAVKEHRQNIEECTRAGRSDWAAYARRELGITLRGAGRYDEAISEGQQAIEELIQLGQADSAAYARRELGVTLQQAGHYDEAISEGQQAIEELTQLGREAEAAYARYVLAQAYRAAGRYDEAVREHQKNIEERTQLGQPDQAAYARRELVVTLRDAGRYDEAVAEGQQTINELTQLGRLDSAAYMRYVLAQTYRAAGRYDEAVREHQKNIKEIAQLEQPDGVAYARQELGVTLREAGRYDEAIAEGQQAIEELAQLELGPHVAYARYVLAQTYRAAGRYDEAMREHQKNIEERTRLRQVDKAAYARRRLGVTLRDAGRYEEAISEGQRTINELTQLGRLDSAAYARYVLAQTYRAAGRYDEAVREHQKNIEERTRLGQPDQAAYARRELGATLRDAGRYDKAIAEGQQAIEELTQLGRLDSAAYARRELGGTLREAGRYDEAMAEGQQAIDELTCIGRPLGVLWARQELAHTYRDWGHFGDAITQHLTAVEMLQPTIQKAQLSDILFGLAITYRHAQQWDNAQKTLNQCLDLEHQLGRVYDEASAERESCMLYREWGRYPEAEEHGLSSLNLGGTPAAIAYRHEVLGRLYQAWGKPKQAKQHLNQALEAYAHLHAEVDVADTKIVLANVAADEGESERAEALMQEGLAIYRRLNRRVKIAEALRELGKLYNRAGKPEEGHTCLEQSLSLYTELDIRPEIEKTKTILEHINEGITTEEIC
jgi:tetratricopeptide (TPR) repeat protein